MQVKTILQLHLLKMGDLLDIHQTQSPLIKPDFYVIKES